MLRTTQLESSRENPRNFTLSPSKVMADRKYIKAGSLVDMQVSRRAKAEIKPKGEKHPRNNNWHGLTPRELELVALLVDESPTNMEIGIRLGISDETVKRHLSNIFDKLGVYNRLELVSKWVYDQKDTPILKQLREEISTLKAVIEEKDKEISMLKANLLFADNFVSEIKDKMTLVPNQDL